MNSHSQPLVSIIMAVKDTAPYLRECIDSIIAQSYQNWELIAANDHSTDATPEILKEYEEKDSRIKVFDSDRKRLIPTLQYAYARSRGELINRMDSDDKMPYDKIEVLVYEWQKYGKRHIIAGGTEHFVDEGEVGGGFLRYEKWLNEVARTSSHYQQIYTECVIPSHCWIIHRDDFDSAGAFNPIVYPEDYDLCFRFYREGFKVIGIDKILHYWRDRSDRISRTWEEYEDNRYFELKLSYFLELDRDPLRPLILWGAGRNGKDMARMLQDKGEDFHWVCDNEKKIGKDIYGVRMEHYSMIPQQDSPQLIIVVNSPDGRKQIRKVIGNWPLELGRDYWFFS